MAITITNMKKPSVSVLTITNLEYTDLLKILIGSLEKQSYDIKEWIILDNSQNQDDFTCSNLLFNEYIKTKKLNFDIQYLNIQNIKTIGEIKNYANIKATGDIIVWASVSDYQFPSRISTIVNKLSKSDKQLACSHNIYFYNNSNKQIKKSINNNLLISNTLAYKKEWGQTHYFDTSDNNYIITFTNNYCEPIEVILPENSVINFIDLNNRVMSSLIKNIQFEILEKETINYLIEPSIYEQINNLNINLNDYLPNDYLPNDNLPNDNLPNDYLPYDIVYLTGANGIEWEPTDMKLGGSEQAVVNLSSEWAKNGYKVVVYGNFKQDYEFNDVKYTNWMNIDITKRIKNLIVWRNMGIVLLMNFDYLVDNIIVDFHDNSSYTLVHFDRNNLLKIFERVNKFAFKSEYHLRCFENFIGRKLSNSEYFIALNGIRIEQFSNNKILNNNKEIIRNPFRFCYCSSYDRGLEYILENIWPHIYQAEPLAEFHVYYGMDYIFDQNFKNKLKLLMSQPGVMDHGRQPMDMIIREKYLSTFQLYLSNSDAEIDCISIRESLVTGCIPIISKFGVFVERHGLQYDWDPSNKELGKAIGSNIIKEMNNDQFVESARKQLMDSDTIISWKTVADCWTKFLM
jgi:hypothetical protein